MRGELSLDALRGLVDDGDIDTVLVVFPDLQGRLMGKRVTGHFFLDEIAGDEGMHACNYLLTVDVDMEPLPGYRFANWDKGYGDFQCVPDLNTLRVIPWLDKTALVICDVLTEEGDVVEVAPRQILKRQLERAREKGLTVKCGSELEFFLFRDSYEEAASKKFQDLTPHASYIEDYHILQTTKDEYLIRAIRNGMDAASVDIEFSKGEWGRGQHEINLVYAEALEMADRHTIYKNGVKEIAFLNGISATFMAKPSEKDIGSSCHIHSSLVGKDGKSAFVDGDEENDTFRHYLGGLRAHLRELALFVAPAVNSYKRYATESWAPTSISWGRDNRTCGFRVVGAGQSRRVECRIPGADVNPYLALSALIAAGLQGVDQALELEPPEEGNAYDSGHPRVPGSLREARELFAASALAREALGDEVVDHYVNNARVELEAFDAAVTDWERVRGFERL